MDTLFENPFLIILLIAIVSSFFKKKKEKPEMRQTTQKSAEKGQTHPNSPFEEVRDIFKEISRSMSENANPQSRKAANKRIRRPQGKVEQMANESGWQETEMVQQTGQTLTEKVKSLPVSPEKIMDKELEIRENQMIDAVIWSEILGPPRAKNPYRKKNFRS